VVKLVRYSKIFQTEHDNIKKLETNEIEESLYKK